MRLRIFTLLAAFAVGVANGGCTENATLPSTTISSLSLSGAAPGVGTTAQFIVTEVPANGSTGLDVTAASTWTVSDTTIATVSKGLVTGVKAGSTTLTATYGGSTVSQQISIHS
jgi:hypothetical protein